ncbi:MAG: tRNA epoxyqueuosine(34) reductase QueG [Clostridium sp.]
MDLKENIKNKIKSLGLDTFGFLKCEIFYELKEFLKEKNKHDSVNEFEEKDIDKKINPWLIMPEGKTIISIAFPYYVLDKQENSEVYFSCYTKTYDYHKVVHKYLDLIIAHIKSLGGNGIAIVDSNPLPERYMAVKSGVGFLGKNNLVITKEHGSYVFLGEIITDLLIEADMPKDNLCGSCIKCIEKCPTKSIKIQNSTNLNGVINNSNICLSYITQKKDIDFPWINLMGGRIFGCDSCQEVCPYNENIEGKILDDFISIDYMDDVNLESLLNLENKSFKDNYKVTSCGWRGKNILIRNAMIVAFNKGKLKSQYGDNIKSPYVKEYFEKLKRNKKK